MVQELRSKTGAGIMECKQALVEAKGDLEQAEILIAKAGHKKAAKTASRVAAEGRVEIQYTADKKHVAIVEVNCETDFVARDVNFLGFCEGVTLAVLDSKQDSLEALNQTQFVASKQLVDAKGSIEDVRKALIAKIGENIQVRRACYINVGNNVLGSYIHHGNKIGVVTILKGGNETLARDLAMHIAASRPKYIVSDEIPASEIALQKEIFMAQAEGSGKNEAIREKMVEGQLRKYFAEICVVGQPFFKEPDKAISVLLKENAAELVRYIRFEVGEGIEVKKASFQEEVMAQVKGGNV